MATGDLANNLRKLQKELKLIKYAENIDLTGMSQGTPASFLPVYHYLFTSYSHAIAEMISTSDTELFGKTDYRFMEALYKIMRDMFSYKPPVTKEQFFNAGFAERKIIMCSEVIQKIREKNKSLQPSKRPTSAVSTIAQNLNKQSRPKSADSSKATSQTAPRKQPVHSRQVDEQKQVKFASEEVVNELLQPVKQKSRHVAHKDPPSPVAIVNMSPSITKEVVPKQEYPTKGFKYAVVTPAVAKQPTKTTRSGESQASKGLHFDETGDIEEVNATTPDTSLYEPLHNSTGIIHGEMQNQLSTLQNSVEEITERLTGFESAMTTVTMTLQNHHSSTDPKLIDLVSSIQHQIENLTARMVLMENRVSIVESKLLQASTSASAETLQTSKQNRDTHSYSASHIRPSLAQGLQNEKQSLPSSEVRQTLSQDHQNRDQMFSSKVRPNLIQEQQRRENPVTSSNYHADGTPQDTKSDSQLRNLQTKDLKDFVNQQQSLVSNGHTEDGGLQVLQSLPTGSEHFSGNTSIPAHVTNSDQFSFAISPIRTIRDTSGFKPGPNATAEDTFALEGDDDARRSSTPTDFKDIPSKAVCDDSESFHFGDVSTQQRVDRIKSLMASTQTMLNSKQ